jgi:hypothetical protein
VKNNEIGKGKHLFALFRGAALTVEDCSFDKEWSQSIVSGSISTNNIIINLNSHSCIELVYPIKTFYKDKEIKISKYSPLAFSYIVGKNAKVTSKQIFVIQVIH